MTFVAGYIRFLICTAGVCNQVFNIHNCRILDKDHIVLRMDYSIDCNDPKHISYTIIAYLILVTTVCDGGYDWCLRTLPSGTISGSSRPDNSGQSDGLQLLIPLTTLSIPLPIQCLS